MAIMPGMPPGMGGGPPPPDLGGGGGGDMGGGGPEGLLKILASLQKQPPPDGEIQAMQQAGNLLSMALSRVQMRSASAAKLLADSISKLQSARESLATEGSQAVASPPDLGMTGGMSPGQLGQGGM